MIHVPTERVLIDTTLAVVVTAMLIAKWREYRENKSK